MTANPATDTDGDVYEYRTYYNNWREKQQLLVLDILPLGLQYRHKLNGGFRLLAATGIKISIPITSTYKTTGGEIVTTGYYSQWNIVLKEMPQHGFNNITNQLTGDVSIKSSCSAFTDLGILYELSKKFDLYVGGYANYGLNNITKSSNNIVYQQDGVYNGIMASNQTDKVRTVAMGFKIGVLWHFKKKDKNPKNK